MSREHAWQQLASGMHVHRYFLAPHRFRRNRVDAGLLALLEPSVPEAAALTLGELLRAGWISRQDVEAVRGASSCGLPWKKGVAVWRRGAPARDADVGAALHAALRLLESTYVASFVDLLLGCLWVVDAGAKPLQEQLTGIYGCVVVEERRLAPRALARRIAEIVSDDLFSLMAVEDAARGELPLDVGRVRTRDEDAVRHAIRSHVGRCVDDSDSGDFRRHESHAKTLRALVDRLPGLNVRQFALTNSDCEGRFSLYRIGLGVGQAG